MDLNLLSDSDGNRQWMHWLLTSTNTVLKPDRGALSFTKAHLSDRMWSNAAANQARVSRNECEISLNLRWRTEVKWVRNSLSIPELEPRNCLQCRSYSSSRRCCSLARSIMFHHRKHKGRQERVRQPKKCVGDRRGERKCEKQGENAH